MVAGNKVYFQEQKGLAVLLDPDKARPDLLGQAEPDYYFIGGSYISTGQTEKLCLEMKTMTARPLVIFPADLSHISDKADAVLLLSLVSGRNPEYLIGKHVVAAPSLKRSGLDILSTAYLLIDSGRATSASYMSGTTGIPYNKPEIAAATALAASMLGMSFIYMDAGSGADQVISHEMISAVREAVDIPILVGGGIQSARQLELIYKAGANLAVIGNHLEKQPDELIDFIEVRRAF